MPRGQNKKIDQSQLQKTFFSKVMGSLYETKRIESASLENVVKAFTEAEASKGKVYEIGDTLPSTLEDIYVDAHTAFGIEHSYKSRTILFAPPLDMDKKRVYRLPPTVPGTINRIVLVAGTHELFECDILGKLMGPQSVFVPQGSAFKLTQGFTDFTYNNKSAYDKNIHPGKGIKHPEKRHLIIFDFISDKPEEVERVQAESLSKATSGLTKTDGLIANLFKSIGYTKQ